MKLRVGRVDAGVVLVVVVVGRRQDRRRVAMAVATACFKSLGWVGFEIGKTAKGVESVIHNPS